MMKSTLLGILLLSLLCSDGQNAVKHYIFTSDVHFGLTKEKFRGETNVSAKQVNAAMAAAMNQLPQLALPNDSCVGAKTNINYIQALIVTGDIANRAEKGIQSATQSWQDFSDVYLHQLQLKKDDKHPTDMYLMAGNHDVSNMIGFHKPMVPATDATAYVNIYNLMMHPSTNKTTQTINYQTDKVHYAKDIDGVHFQFINLWPDNTERAWMEQDLKTVPTTTPVLVFAHANPDVEARFFINPNGDHSINEKDHFENLLSETFKDGSTVNELTVLEQKAWVAFLQKHPNIKAYFHGHSVNHTEYYTWTGPDKNIQLKCVRVDSPMKGHISAKDETKLSFELISIDAKKKLLSVRECLWNSQPSQKNLTIEWGLNTNISLL